MRRLLDSLVVRIGLIFLGGLLVLQVSIMAVILWPDGRPAVFRLVSPEKAAAIATALEAAPAEQRPMLVEALNGVGQTVQMQARYPDDAPTANDVRRSARWVERAFERYGDALDGRPFLVQTRPSRALATLLSSEVGAPGSIRLVVRLRTGEALIVERAPILLQRFFARLLPIALVITVILAAGMALCMIQLARPIDQLAQGARLLAGDVGAPALTPKGAREIKDLARALNDMKLQIRSLLDERTLVLAAIAHDLRTYLTRLRLRVDFVDDPDQRNRAIRDLEEMSLLLDDTLTFATETRAGADGRERVDLTAEITAFAAARGELGEPVETDIAGPSVLVAARPLAIRRMIANLVDNALRYAGAARLKLTTTETGAMLAVEDEGPGIPDEMLTRLTEPFRRLEPSRGRQTGGAGLGLAIVKALAESQGGRLTLENRAGGGLRATVHLPLLPEAAVTL